MNRRLSVVLFLSAALSAGVAAAQTNPFFAPSTLPFQAPPFDKIKDSDFKPALEEGMKRQLAEIEAIANNGEAPTFANTIEAMERSGDLLTRTSKVFFAIVQANTNETLQKVEAEESPKLAAHLDAIYLDPKLFARVKALYDARQSSGLDTESKFLLERYYRNFVRAGALLSEADKKTLRALNQEESKLNTEFHDHVLGDTNASSIVVDDKAMLAGMSDADVAAAAEAAKERGLTGKWVLALRNTTQQPQLASLENRELRKRLLAASENRGRHGGANDTRGIVVRMAKIRAEKAKLLGYPNWATYVLDDQMAKTPKNAIKLMTDLVAGSTKQARQDAARMQKLASHPIAVADWEFYAENVRKAQYALDDAQVKPYFSLDRVLQDGVFYAANQLYGITFKERKDLPVYHPDVKVYDVLDADGKPLAIWYADYYARPSKSGGAWEDTFLDQSGLLGTHPVVFNVANYPKPAPGQPSLLSFDDVTTTFHEFGHALHSMFSNVKYPTLAGTATPRDFVEFPSQFNEHWALEPAVFANYAKHYQTGAPMPQELVDKIKRSRKFDQGYALTEYLAAALLDMAWHTLPATAPMQDALAFERAALQRYHIAVPQVPPRYHTTYFSHIWNGGYSAGYYAYLWSEVIDDDAFYWFKAHGGMTRANGQRFREMVLSRGGTMPAAEMYKAFAGHEPSVEPLLIERGLKEPPKDTKVNR
jgi:peptidyl-dipeptidase Dcp